MQRFTSIILSYGVFATLFTSSLAAPQLLEGALSIIGTALGLIPILSTPPPTSLWTQYPNDTCADVNGGALYCCESTFNGDIPLVVEVAPLVAYKLNPNSINCIYGRRNFNTCNPGTQLCCQVDVLAVTPISDLVSLALYCQNAPGTNASTSTCSSSGSG